MSNEIQNKPNGEKRLTLDDPVSPEVIQNFRQIGEAQTNIAMEMVALEERKIQLLAGNKKLREQHERLFQAILVERGQHPQTPAELDGKSGKIVLKVPAESPPPAEPAPSGPPS